MSEHANTRQAAQNAAPADFGNGISKVLCQGQACKASSLAKRQSELDCQRMSCVLFSLLTQMIWEKIGVMWSDVHARHMSAAFYIPAALRLIVQTYQAASEQARQPVPIKTQADYEQRWRRGLVPLVIMFQPYEDCTQALAACYFIRVLLDFSVSHD